MPEPGVTLGYCGRISPSPDPHVGEIAQFGLFRPVDSALNDFSLSDAQFVGVSLASYRYDRHTWGLPLDELGVGIAG